MEKCDVDEKIGIAHVNDSQLSLSSLNGQKAVQAHSARLEEESHAKNSTIEISP